MLRGGWGRRQLYWAWAVAAAGRHIWRPSAAQFAAANSSVPLRRSMCTEVHNTITRIDEEVGNLSLKDVGRLNNQNVSLTSSSLSARVEKLGRDQNVVLAFQSWMGEGHPVQRGDVFHAINRLRKLKKYRRALQFECTLSIPSGHHALCYAGKRLLGTERHHPSSVDVRIPTSTATAAAAAPVLVYRPVVRQAIFQGSAKFGLTFNTIHICYAGFSADREPSRKR